MTKNQSYLVIHPDKLRDWIASALHRGNMDYFPKTEDIVLNPPTHWIVRCSCGKIEDSYDIANLNRTVMKEKFDEHVKDAIREMAVEYKEDWSDLV